MNLYFGKVSQKFDLKQIEEGYYQAPKNSTWFGELKIGDYVYLIGGGKIQFWKAKEWKIVDGVDRLYFDILNNNLGINVNDLIAIKFFKLTKAFVVLTSRSARNRAFFKIEKLEDIAIDNLADSDFYKNDSIYRHIKIVDKSNIDPQSKNIQIYLEDGLLRIFNAPFVDSEVINSFRDNLKFQGQGSKFKDNTLAKIKDKIHQSTEFSNKQLGLRAFYDAFFCEYAEKKKYYVVGTFWKDHEPEDMTDTFVKEDRWENGYDEKFNQQVKQIPEGSFIAIKAAYVKEKTHSVMSIKARGIVVKNHGDGKNLDVNWEEDFIPFEVPIGSYRQTIHEVTNREHIENIWENEALIDMEVKMNNNELLNLLRYKKQIVLQGPPGTGKTRLARELASLLINDSEPESHPVRELDNHILFKILKVGDTVQSVAGKTSYEIVEIKGHKVHLKGDENEITHKEITFDKIKDYFNDNKFEEPVGNGNDRGAAALAKLIYERVYLHNVIKTRQKLIQFHPSYTYEDFVRGITSKSDIDGKGIIYDVENKVIALIARQAISDPSKDYVLIIDEINRANLPSVLGELIYALEYRGEAVESMYEVKSEGTQLVLPQNLYIIGTMNTADRSVGHIDYAIRRRFAFVDVLPKILDDNSLDEGQTFDENLFIKVGKLFIDDYKGEDIQNDLSLKKSTYLSGEFDPKDVMLGHSYFIEKESCPMETRLTYEIKPILMEYVKDGVLKESALAVINKLSVKNDG